MAKKKEIINATFHNNVVVSEDSDIARELYNQSRFGDVHNNRVELSLIEAMYLIEKEKIVVLDGRKKPIDTEKFLKRAKTVEKNIWTRYKVFKNMRDRGYIVKTALKFGADFRVYDRGIKPGEDHAKWVLYPVHESEVNTWYEFAAKNRVAHSTKKRLLIGIVDSEGDVTYYEIKWTRP
ncbi:tRNA-intron lyase [Candidatus Woesearchaeota archaeon]|nr:tRNA-intron lyase [Candidatus Woesearchaeota archaeon]